MSGGFLLGTQYMWSHAFDEGSLGGGESTGTAERRVPLLRIGQHEPGHPAHADGELGVRAAVRPATATAPVRCEHVVRRLAAVRSDAGANRPAADDQREPRRRRICPTATTANQRADRRARASDLYPANQTPGSVAQHCRLRACPRAARGATSARNIVRGPGLFQIDLALQKRFAISGARNFEFRWEAFNAFNRMNLGDPGTNISVAGAVRPHHRPAEQRLRHRHGASDAVHVPVELLNRFRLVRLRTLLDADCVRARRHLRWCGGLRAAAATAPRLRRRPRAAARRERQPVRASATLAHDPDDPAIWVHPTASGAQPGARHGQGRGARWRGRRLRAGRHAPAARHGHRSPEQHRRGVRVRLRRPRRSTSPSSPSGTNGGCACSRSRLTAPASPISARWRCWRDRREKPGAPMCRPVEGRPRRPSSW